ncbi:RHS repeat domain-containing protein [Chryseobacterium sp. S-02]|uniref:RHS repeat domain-containing protein n=1 Tax=Chryseobacterium sp. S-02 TaxID=3404064 RepID=UPI003CEC2685
MFVISFNRNSAEVLEENNYYPFGLKHQGYNALTGNPSYKYQYNGKELQEETGWNDYGARMYMSDIGRWAILDPLSEQMRRYSPYNYAFNNPISYIDPDGRKSMIYSDGGVMRWDYDPYTTLSGVAWFEESFKYLSFGGAQFLAQGFTGGGGYAQDGESPVPGSPTYSGQEAYDVLQQMLNPENDYDFSQFDFSQVGSDGGPSPKRKYLQQKNKAYFGILESSEQYQLDHPNWVEEFDGMNKRLSSIIDIFSDLNSAFKGAGISGTVIGNLNTIKDLANDLKSFNPSLASIISIQSMTVGTAFGNEANRMKQFLDIYTDANSKYQNLHKYNPSLSKGVTVNVQVIIGTNGGGYTNLSIYDISTHRYLSGGKIVHRY